MPMFYQMNGFYGLGMFFWFLFWIVLVMVIIAAVVKLSNHKIQVRGTEETALEILKKRYVKGEISHEQYVKMKKELKN